VIKLILTLLSFSALLSAETVGYLLSSEGSEWKFHSEEKIERGVSGVVQKSLDGGRYSYIVATATVIDDDKVQLSEFSMLKQPNLSKGLWKPSAGDKIIFKSFYDRGIIIAPNLQNYQTIRNSSEVQWLHPDIFSATLNSFGQVRPLKEDFSYICQQHLIGLIYLNVDNRVLVKDCFSGETIRELNIELPTDGTVQKPFYSRIEKLSPDLFGSGTDQFIDYNRYYRELF
jgi:hypothetical protein